MSVALLFNPISGSGRALVVAQALERGLSASGHRVVLVPTERRDPAIWLRPLLRDATALVVAGGDGAVRLAASEAARAEVPLWHAPCGTENLFARAFGMRADARAIVAALAGGRSRAIDLGSAGETPFAIMGSVGFDAEVVHALAARRRGGISHLSYAGPILEQLAQWRPRPLAWTVDGEREQLGPGLVVVGNLPDYGVGLNPAAGARPDDGQLDAVYLPAERAIDLLPWLPLLRLGLHVRLPWMRERRGAEIVLEAPAEARLQVDGDAVERPSSGREIVFRASPGALRVLLPAPR